MWKPIAVKLKMSRNAKMNQFHVNIDKTSRFLTDHSLASP